MYHISDIKKYMRCERLYYYSKDVDTAFIPYIRTDDSLYELLIQYLKIDKYFQGVKNDAPSLFVKAYEEYEWFVNARIGDGELRSHIPFMHKTKKGLDLYFIYYGINVKELDSVTYFINTKILEKMSYAVHKIYLLLPNENYVNNGVLNANKLFICTSKYKHQDILSYSLKKGFDYEEVLTFLKEKKLEDFEPKKNHYCKCNGLCKFYESCFPNEKKLPDDSILTLVSSQYKNKMYEEGIEHLKDADVSKLEGNAIQFAQIMASKNNGLYLSKAALKEWIKPLNVRPISFIDFEWDRYLLPIYKGMRPMEVVCFEFALYILDENGHLEHRTFVGNQDCRKEFVEGLLKYVPSHGPILAYNAAGAECLRLKELGEYYPEFKEQLDAMASRFIDLADPFLAGLIYDTRMQGNYTLKKLVSICSDYNYSNLDIYDGMNAVMNYRNMDKQENNQIEENLKEYCSLDAYGLFLVYRWLIKLLVYS